MAPPALPAADFFATVSVCLGRWDTDGFALPGGTPDGWLNKSVVTALANLASTLTMGSDPDPWRRIADSMAQEAHIPPAMATALLVRIWTDSLGHEAFRNLAIVHASKDLRDQWASTWACAAFAAYEAGWFPELARRPATAAGTLAGGNIAFWRPLAARIDERRPNFLQRLAAATGILSRSTDRLPAPVQGYRLPPRVTGLTAPLVGAPVGLEDYCVAVEALHKAAGLPEDLSELLSETLVNTVRAYADKANDPSAPAAPRAFIAAPKPATKPQAAATAARPATRYPSADFKKTSQPAPTRPAAPGLIPGADTL